MILIGPGISLWEKICQLKANGFGDSRQGLYAGYIYASFDLTIERNIYSRSFSHDGLGKSQQLPLSPNRLVDFHMRRIHRRYSRTSIVIYKE
jgi:hypothetical protein